MRFWLTFVVSLCVGVALAGFAGWALGLIPDHVPYCYYEQGYKTCATYNVALFTIWKIGEALNWIAPAITAAATGAIALLTKRLWQINRGQLQHGQEVERAYVSGGGPLDGAYTSLLFTIDNSGKTPATMLAYAVEFCPLDRIPLIPAYNLPNYARRVPYSERIPPGKMNNIRDAIPIPPDIPRPLLAYGRHWYTDIWKERHSSGFVLVIEAAGTHGRIPDNIPPAYTDWD